MRDPQKRAGREQEATGATVAIEAHWDRSLVWWKGNSVRYLAVEVIAPVRAPDPTWKSPALHLALAVDASGSMAGEPLEAAKQAAWGIAQGLGEADRLSIVSFADEVITHVSSLPMDAAGQQAVAEALRSLTARGSTDLGAGWLAAAACVARDMDAPPAARHHVVVLSDGHANQGLIDPAALGHHAGELRVRGLLSSAVGIGDEYQTAQLEAIATHGGGRLHRAARPQEIIEVLLAELAGWREMAVENVTLQMGFPLGSRLACLNGFPVSFEKNQLSCVLGTLPSGARRQVIFRVKLPAGVLGQPFEFTTQARWCEPGQYAVEREGDLVPVVLRAVRGVENTAQVRDLVVAEPVASLWQAHIVRRVVEMNRSRENSRAQGYLQRELKPFEAYCQGLTSGSALVAELRKLLRVADRDWREADRKEMELAMYQRGRNEKDQRAHAPPTWSAFVPE